MSPYSDRMADSPRNHPVRHRRHAGLDGRRRRRRVEAGVRGTARHPGRHRRVHRRRHDRPGRRREDIRGGDAPGADRPRAGAADPAAARAPAGGDRGERGLQGAARRAGAAQAAEPRRPSARPHHGQRRRGRVREALARRPNRWFSFGAYATPGVDRAGIVRRAVERGEAMLGCDVPNSDIFVVGDTPLDVQAAHAVDCTAIAVATGNTTRRPCARPARTTFWRRSSRSCRLS